MVCRVYLTGSAVYHPCENKNKIDDEGNCIISSNGPG